MASPNDEIDAEVERQFETLSRGVVELISPDELKRKLRVSLKESRPLRVKLGVDPTAHDLHLGFTLPLSKLQQFARLGHQPVLIIGDATAMVGDPSGKNKARPQLTKEQVEAFAASYLEQASRVLDLERTEIRRNSEWLHDLEFPDIVRLMASATVAQMLAREDFARRYDEGTPIYLHELLYPLMQGYDSVIVEADVELGGHDQLFNLLVGRDLQQAAGQEPQVCMMGPLLVGLDGKRKMSKSFGNTIGVTDAPNEMFGKVMSLPDDLMRPWFELLTDLPLVEIDRVLTGSSPRDAKEALARAIVSRYHSEEAANAAAAEFRRVFSEGALPEKMDEIPVPRAELDPDGRIWIVRLLAISGFAASNGEARRLVRQGGVRLGESVVGDESAAVRLAGGEVLRVGKRRFGRIRLV